MHWSWPRCVDAGRNRAMWWGRDNAHNSDLPVSLDIAQSRLRPFFGRSENIIIFAKMPPNNAEAAQGGGDAQQNKIGDEYQYWSAAAPDVDSMLGGFAHISPVELRGSRAFLAKMGIGLQAGRRRVTNALEGGAGYVMSSQPRPGLVFLGSLT